MTVGSRLAKSLSQRGNSTQNRLEQVMAPRRGKEKKEDEISERTAPTGEVVYHAVYREGEHELERGTAELALSGLAAGLSMGFSPLSESLLQAHLSDAPWRPLLTKLGYSVGFVIVILGRQQLFTKNTLTVILPLLRKLQPEILGKVARLWIVVLATNLIGAFLFAWLLGKTNVFDENVRATFSRIATEAIQPSFGLLLLRGILAGWLIALMVWLLPFAESARFWVVILLAYIIGLAGLPHVIAGNVETFYLVTVGGISLGRCLIDYLLPALLGNVIGGVALVALGAR
jgi:formate-nitrite transporter family protein